MNQEIKEALICVADFCNDTLYKGRIGTNWNYLNAKYLSLDKLLEVLNKISQDATCEIRYAKFSGRIQYQVEIFGVDFHSDCDMAEKSDWKHDTPQQAMLLALASVIKESNNLK